MRSSLFDHAIVKKKDKRTCPRVCCMFQHNIQREYTEQQRNLCQVFTHLLLLALPGGKLTLVEFQFLAFQDVTITTARLTWTRRDASQQTALVELIVQGVFKLVATAALSVLALYMVRLLFSLVGRNTLLLAELHTVVVFIPLHEWMSIHLDDSVLHQSLVTNQFVVRRVVHNIQHTSLS